MGCTRRNHSPGQPGRVRSAWLHARRYVGRHIANFHADRAIIDDILARLSGGEKLDKYPARLRAKDGSIRHVQISSNVRFETGASVNTRCFTVDVTAQHQAEALLRERERQSRALLDVLPAAVYTTDAEGRITYYNEAAVELSGRRPKLGSDQWCVTWRLYRPDGTPLPHDECPMAVALKENRPIRGAEAVAERPDGSRVPFIPFPTPLHDESGAMVGAVNMLVDITERKGAEEALRESDERFRALVDTSAQIVWTVGAEGAVVEDSPSWRAFTGQTFEQWRDFGWLDAINPGDRERVSEAWRDAFARTAPIEIDYRLRGQRRMALDDCARNTSFCC